MIIQVLTSFGVFGITVDKRELREICLGIYARGCQGTDKQGRGPQRSSNRGQRELGRWCVLQQMDTKVLSNLPSTILVLRSILSILVLSVGTVVGNVAGALLPWSLDSG
ncbi:hypothetical protein BJX61DRAFT_526099 [Aspergillus egyptiacus]|nr:hypothetical protein BJX61DRAFT_526099 [Aspergillus egyptiacus]